MMPGALRFAAWSLAAAALLAGRPVRLGATEPWTLDRALEAAFANNPDARIARHRMAGAEAMLQQAQADRMPQLSLHASYSQTNSPMAAFGSILNQRAFDSSLDFNDPGRIDNLNLTGTVAYRLYDGGQTASGITAARHVVRSNEEGERATLHRLGAEVVKAYLNIRKTAEAVTAVEAGVRSYEAAVDAGRARFDAGRMLKADLLSLEVQLAQTREALILARHETSLAGRSFLFVIGADASAGSVELAPGDSALERIRMPVTLDPSPRPELIALQAAFDAARARVAAARGERRPSVNAFASYQHDRSWKLNEHESNWIAGVAVDMNIFDGGAISGRIRASETAMAETRELLRRTQLAIGLEIEQAKLAQQQAVERVSVTAAAIAQAEESAALSRARFSEGALQASELIDVESRLIGANTRHILARADERIALADLRRSVGLPPIEKL